MSDPVLGTVDVAVLGSGAAGCTAAIAAARAGASTLLIEKSACLGGTSTALFDTFHGFYAPGKDARKVVGGIADEVVDGLATLGSVVITRAAPSGAEIGVTYHPEHLKLVWERLVSSSGAEVVLNCFAQDAAMADGRVYAVLLATKLGLCEVRARVFIDATGDASLCHFAGLACEPGAELDGAPTLTTTVRMCNVDAARCPATTTISTRLKAEDQDRRLTGRAAWLYLSSSEIASRADALERLRRLTDTVPGYEQAELAQLSTEVGVSETRHICGDYLVTREDVLSAREFDDQIGLCGAPLESHREGGGGHPRSTSARGQAIGIPFGAMLPRDAVNVIVAGRCISATRDAQASLSSMAQCMAIGQAAGEAAAMAAHYAAGATRAIDRAELRQRLAANGAILELECDDAATGSHVAHTATRGRAARPEYSPSASSRSRRP